ncbi:hypothetical protein MQX03_04435 [Chryseobacterium aahli]|uniref:hypothetical protein n=1 Tax=Chryseobacterium aahli TaxID=1278643 RepID=UPI001F60A293|nr:hypothetical protein [Chryseobacterium aahli]MCI3936434.1 hypothetical protein [Chryseobacterium aahli]
MNIKPIHNFHIPVMGLAYTIDTPIRLAHLGISSVISIIDDEIIEKMRSFYSEKFNIKYKAISTKTYDYRCERITAYLNMVDDIVNNKFQAFKKDLISNIVTLKNFIAILPNTSLIKAQLQQFISSKGDQMADLKNYVNKHLSPGSIDVNIMTKVDKENFLKNEQLPNIYNDAHSSLRGFAKSKLSSSMVLSAGFNPKLYSYIEQFEDFYPDNNDYLKKQIIIKVSDFRSAMIQGNFLAKKGLWVSEYRIESGLNCGGHAFASDGFLLGPILEEFKQRKHELIESAFTLMVSSLQNKNKHIPSKPSLMKITVQGGVGTAEEHLFLLENYNIDSVGWGSPFLLVPEATSVDFETRKLLAMSKENDFYLSNISPLGVPFNTVRGSSNEILRKSKKNYGSSCPKKLLALNKEYSPKGICTASKKFQNLKLDELLKTKDIKNSQEFSKEKEEIIEKSCLCVGLANAAYLEHGIEIKGEKQGVVICPGPNLAYFDSEVTLSQMIQHIYGNGNILSSSYRPNMFVNELKMYVDYFKKHISKLSETNLTEQKKWNYFKQNILNGIAYYDEMFKNLSFFRPQAETIAAELQKYKLLLLE